MGRAARVKRERRAANPPHPLRPVAVADAPPMDADPLDTPFGRELLALVDGPRLVEDRYQLGGRIGVGGIKVVYVALDTSTGQPVALAIYRDPDGPIYLDRALTVAALPPQANLMRVLRAGVFATPQGDALPMLVSELLSGANLTDTVKARGPLDWRGVVRLADDLLAGLQHLHEHGLILGVPHTGNIVVADRGVFCDYDWTRSPGTPASEPTQILPIYAGQPANQAPPEWFTRTPLDERGDLYVLGLSLYYALTMQFPHTQGCDESTVSAALVARRMRDMPLAPSQVRPGLPKEVDDLVLSMLVPDRTARIQSAAEARAFVRRIADRYMIWLTSDVLAAEKKEQEIIGGYLPKRPQPTPDQPE